MAQYRIRETGELVADLARAFPHISMPPVLSSEDMEMLGVDPVFEAPTPVTTPFQTAYRDGVEEIEGKWYVKYAIADMDPEGIAGATEQQWASIRSDRGSRLAACDWTQLPDTPLTEAQKAEWAVYRQALRDITTQADPFNIVWPEEPKQ